jgi:predicted amidohydrolase
MDLAVRSLERLAIRLIDIEQSDMPNVMSKMMLLGMSFPEVLVRSTVNPPGRSSGIRSWGRGAWGGLRTLRCSRNGAACLAFKDSWPAKRLGAKRLECVLTVRGGKVVYEGGSGSTGAADTKVYDLLVKHGHLGIW